MASYPLAALSIHTNQESPLQMYAQLSQIQQMKQMAQSRNLEIQKQQQDLKDQQATTAAIKAWDGKDPEDLAKAVSTNGGSANARLGIEQHFLNLKKTYSDIAKQDAETGEKNFATLKGKNDLLIGGLDNIKKLPDEQLAQGAASYIQDATQRGLIDQQHAQGLLQGIQGKDPATIRQGVDFYEKNLMGHAAAMESALKEQETRKAGAEAAAKENEALWYKQHPNAGAPGVPTETASAADWLAKPENKGKTLSDYNIAMKKIVPAFNFQLQNTGTTGSAADVAKRFGMSPVAFDQAAEKYWTSGQLPPAGRGGPALATNKAIMNRAAELHPEGSLAANSAEYAANKESLGKLQSNLDQVSAFESTANKNLAMFTSLAQKAVNTDIPLLNAPLRTGAKLLAGSEDQLAMDAARQVAVNEIAKVTGSPGLSGQLSDTARKEVAAFIPESATYGQALRVAQVLTQDMANRHQSYQEQIADIKKRMGGKSEEPPASKATQHVAGGQAQGLQDGATGKGSDGKNYIVKGGKWVPQ